MKYNDLQIAKSKKITRVGRGIAAGRGKTAGRGTKGQGSRTGSKAKPGFAGGANPLMQQLPKLPGFKSHRAKTQNVTTEQLNQFANKTVDTQVLASAKLINDAYTNVKVVSKGELDKKVTVKLQGASQSAIAAIEAAGGSFEQVARTQRPKTSTNKKEK